MTSPSPLTLGTPFSLGDPSVLHTARVDRLALGVNFLPSTTALGAVSGIVHGPTNSVGALTLVSDGVVRVDPFVAVLQGTHNTRQGQYVVPNEQQRDLAIVAKDASLFRRSLLVVRVADSAEAGVAPSAATNGAWLERLDGALAASNPALPALPQNALALGELSVPSAASGQPVQLTPYNPRTGARHGILPVFDDASTVAGHGAAPGSFVGQYRDHPARGAERWNGGAWIPASPLDAPMVRVRRAPTGVASSSFTTLTWTVEDIDTHDMRTAANPAALTVRRSGIYRVGFGCFWQGAIINRTALRVYRAPAANPAAFGTYGKVSGTHPNGNQPGTGSQAHGLMLLFEGDLVRFDAYQDSGIVATTSDDDFAATYAEMQWLRPL